MEVSSRCLPGGNEENTKAYVRLASLPTEIRIGLLLNTSLERYSYVNPLPWHRTVDGAFSTSGTDEKFIYAFILFGVFGGKWPLGRPKHSLEDNIVTCRPVDRQRQRNKFWGSLRNGYEGYYHLDIMPCCPLKVNRNFGETYCLHLQGRRISRARNQPENLKSNCLSPAFTPVSCSAYSSTLKMKTTCSSENSADFQRTT
jgi:hypothetical protein